MYQNDMKEKAKKVNIIDFLRETYPELVFERKDGSFAYSKNPAMTFFAVVMVIIIIVIMQPRKKEINITPAITSNS